MKSELSRTKPLHFCLLVTAMLLLATRVSRGDRVEIHCINRSGGAVECQIYRIGADTKLISLGHTESGKLIASSGCPSGCSLLFVPDEGSTYFKDRTPCPLRQRNFVLQKISGEDLEKLAAQLTGSPQDSREAAKSALIANEIADRVNKKTIKQAYETDAVIQASKFLNVDKPVVFDQSQKRVVATAQFDNQVRRYQEQQGLKPPGSLNYPTLTRAAGTTAAQLLSNTSGKR